MSPFAIGGIVGVFVSIGYYLWLGFADRTRTHSLASYFFDNWQLKRRMVAASQFSSSMSLATVVISLLQLGVIFGVGLSWATITFCIGWSCFVLVLPRIRARTDRTDTIHSFLARRYQSDSVRLLSALATIAGFLGLFSTELFAADGVLGAFGLPAAWSLPTILVFASATVAYAALGGFRSVVRSDWSQTTLLVAAIAILGVLAFIRWSKSGSPTLGEIPQFGTWTLPAAVLIGLFFINVPYPFVDTQAWQRGRAAATDGDATRGTRVAVVMFVATWSALIVIAALIAPTLATGDDPFRQLVRTATDLTPIGAAAAGLLLAPGLAAALFSSADGFINSAAHVYSLDVAGLRSRSELTFEEGTARRHVVTLGVLGLAVAIGLRELGFGIVDMVFAVSAGQLALLPSVGYALWRPDSRDLGYLRTISLASIGMGFAAAWLNGLYAVVATARPELAFSSFPPDVYKSPACAVLASGSIFLVGAAIASFRRTGRAW